jgi:hypothetical protein
VERLVWIRDGLEERLETLAQGGVEGLQPGLAQAGAFRAVAKFYRVQQRRHQWQATGLVSILQLDREEFG